MSAVIFADGREVREFAKPYIIAEVNSSHNGSVETAKKMVDAAVEAGCDCVKFQSWSTQSLYSKTYYKQNPIAKRFVDKLALSPDALRTMASYCKQKNIGFSSTPYSRQEVDFLADECEVPFIKVSSMEVNNPAYIRYIADTQLPVVISTGMADYDEVQRAVRIIEGTGNKKIVILHCVSIYPVPMEQANLRNILGLRERFCEYPVGYSDHTLGCTAAIAAAALGAAVIEKHITLDAKKIGMDNQMAMEPDALGHLVRECAAASSALGTEERMIHPEEIKQRESMRRSIVVTRNLKTGDLIKETDLDVKRPGTGIAPERMAEIIGRRVNKDIEADMVLMESDLDE